MTEEEAREHVLSGVPRETVERLEIYCKTLIDENARQNLIAASTIDHLWSRHILDSAQLLRIITGEGTWIDLGSGAGLPGLVIATLTQRPLILIEPRAKRCIFLRDVADRMGLADRVTVVASRAETAPKIDAAVISARAVAPLPALFAMGQGFATPETTWLLMKGRTAAEEVEAGHASWHARIALVPSITDPEAAIVVASDVRLKGTRS